MHPAAMWWWKRRQAEGHGHGCGAEAGCGPSERPRWQGPPPWAAGEHEGFGGGPFGVRRPLRFLAYKLELDDAQVREVARILDELKTERAQDAVDQRRTSAAFADALTTEAFDEAEVDKAADLRVKSAERMKSAIVRALQKLHAVLRPEQRESLATLMRTGAVVM